MNKVESPDRNFKIILMTMLKYLVEKLDNINKQMGNFRRQKL